MVTLVVALVVFGAIFGAFLVPLLVVLRFRSAPGAKRKYLIAAGVLALLCALGSADKVRLERQCDEAGSPNCVDHGTQGMQTLFVLLFAGTALTKAYLVFKD